MAVQSACEKQIALGMGNGEMAAMMDIAGKLNPLAEAARCMLLVREHSG